MSPDQEAVFVVQAAGGWTGHCEHQRAVVDKHGSDRLPVRGAEFIDRNINKQIKCDRCSELQPPSAVDLLQPVVCAS